MNMVDNNNYMLSKDKIDVELSLRQLRDNLLDNRSSEDAEQIIVAQSRKGPKIVEVAVQKSELSKFDIITELAVPYFFLLTDSHQQYDITIVDDAVYYGSTLYNLYKELLEYADAFNLSPAIKAFVAIKDKGSMPMSGMMVYGNEEIREGFGHYFVKEIMKKFRRFHRCMEVEYPVVTYMFTTPIDIDRLKKELASRYEGFYAIDHTEGCVLNVLLPEQESQFRKIRMYPDGNMLHVVVMSPRNIPDNPEVLENLMKSQEEGIGEMWQYMTRRMLKASVENDFRPSLCRNIRRSLVVLANYIFSYQDYLCCRNDLEKAFCDSGLIIENSSLSESGLYQLVGQKSIVYSIMDYLSRQRQQSGCGFSNMLEKAQQRDCLVYEEERFPSQGERLAINAHNEHMVHNSLSWQESLSALFFNQTLFVERWSRAKTMYEGRRLWFGYTHDSLLSMIKKHSRYELPNDIVLKIHQWVDGRIDMGCVVPQYILDKSQNMWIRVLRPGENEDLLLSHLARFVIHIYNLVNRKMGLGYVPLAFFEGVLAVVYKRLWKSTLANQFEFKLYLDRENHLRLSSEDSGASSEVVSYLRKMYVLETEDNEVTIAPRITDAEFCANTTIEREARQKVDAEVDEIMNKYAKSKVSPTDASSIFNYYLNSDMEEDVIVKICRDSSKSIMSVVDKIESLIRFGDVGVVDGSINDKLIDTYQAIVRYDVNPIFYTDNGGSLKSTSSDQENERFVRIQTEFKRMIYIINVLIAIFVMKSFDSFKNFVTFKSKDKEFPALKLDILQEKIDTILNDGDFNDKAHQEQLLRTIRNVLIGISIL